jgi:hypothetical protein
MSINRRNPTLEWVEYRANQYTLNVERQSIVS